MIYATVADFVSAFGEEETIELSNLDDPAAEDIEELVIDAALETASADIDSYLRSAGYALPLTELPRVLVGRCNDIARYKLDRNRTREEVRLRYLDAMAWLKDLAKGTASLGITTTTSGATGTPQVAMPVFTSPNRTFTLDSLSDY
jgi:phage gp36-like protein